MFLNKQMWKDNMFIQFNFNNNIDLRFVYNDVIYSSNNGFLVRKPYHEGTKLR